MFIFFYYVNKMKVKYLILFTLKELIPTSDSNVVVSLTRLFEVLLCNVVENDPTSKHIRVWIMVGFILIVFFNYGIKYASGKLVLRNTLQDLELFFGENQKNT